MYFRILPNFCYFKTERKLERKENRGNSAWAEFGQWHHVTDLAQRPKCPARPMLAAHRGRAARRDGTPTKDTTVTGVGVGLHSGWARPECEYRKSMSII
jgi:hypothetical protein